jgi:acyl carrier protein
MSPEHLVAKVFGLHPGQVTDATSNQDTAEWDSLGHVTLIMELEGHYGVSFSTEEALGLTSVGALKRALAERSITW